MTDGKTSADTGRTRSGEPGSPSGGAAGLVWRCLPFDALTGRQLDAVYRIRQQVFVVEQQCVYLDADGCDSRALHLIACSDASEDAPLAYARILQPGLKYPEPSIGRVLTREAARGTGLGRELVGRAVAACHAAHPLCAIRISAQARLEAFYASFGFASVGEPYQEDGIAHREMLLDAPPRG